MRFSTISLPHCFSVRNDGNLAFHVGDDPENVRENRARFARNNGFALKNLVAAQQTHGTRLEAVGASDAGRGALDYATAAPQTDALLSVEKGLPLLILVADCAPLLFHDCKTGAFAVVHAGWRGANGGIAGQTVRALQRYCGSSPGDLKVGIGPCLSVQNLEIGAEVAAQIHEKTALDFGRGEKPHLDLRGLLTLDLERAGVARDQIETSPLCPRENLGLFFSHRGENGQTGRMGLVAWRD